MTYADHAHDAELMGLEPIPLRYKDKAPAVDDWTGELHIDRWVAQGWPGMGLRTGLLVAVDVDITDPTLSRRVCEAIHDIVPSPIVRVGKAPKLALLYRRDPSEPEQGKRSSARYALPSGDTAQVEILGRGQQLAAEGLHPDTGEPYHYPAKRWDDLALSEYPTITTDDVDAILDAFDTLMTEAGLEAVGRGTATLPATTDDPDAAYLLSMARPIGASLEELDAVAEGSDMPDRASWVRVGMALHHETNGSPDGLAIWQRHSWQDEQTQQDCAYQWERFQSAPGTRASPPVTLRSLPAAQSVIPTEKPAFSVVDKTKRTGIVKIGDLDLAPPSFLVDGILEEGATAVWFGTPASFKSFVAVDLSLCIATGTAWHGHDIDRQGAVLYICGEGHAGIARRVEAWCRTHGFDRNTVEFYKTDRAMNFTSAERVAQLKHDVLAGVMPAPVLVPVDTIARNLGGDENSAEDFASLFEAIDDFRDAIPGVTFLLIGHPGLKDSKRPRGSSSQEGNVDSMVRIVREAGHRYLSRIICMKMKDAVHFSDHVIGMKEIELGHDQKGRPYTSLSACAEDEAHCDGEAVAQAINYAAMTDEQIIKVVQRQIIALAAEEKVSRASVKAALGEEFPWHNTKYSTALDGLRERGFVAGKPVKLTDAGRQMLDIWRWDGEEENWIVHEQ